MRFKHSTSLELCQRLAHSGAAEHLEVAAEIFDRLCDKWKATEVTKEPRATSFRGLCSLGQIRLRGAMDIEFLVLGAMLTQTHSGSAAEIAANHRLALVVVSSSQQGEIVRRYDNTQRVVILLPKDVDELLTLPHPLEELKKRIRKQISIRRLIAFDITHPVSPNMFFGRRELLDRFHDEETTSFAIAGPGRIGKSSLLTQFRYELRVRQDARRSRLRFIDCYPYGALSPDHLAERIAMEISGTLQASRTKQHTFLRFLKWQSEEGETPLELLLDEVDGVCLNEAFEVIGDAVKSNYCRIIICGKGQLYRLMCRKETHLSQFGQRLELIIPEPLPWNIAEQLLIQPLEDLGFRVPHPASVCAAVFRQTNRRPHLIQACARMLVEAAIQNSTHVITAESVEDIRPAFQSRFFSAIPLEDLQDDLTRLIALLLLRAGGYATPNITIAYTQALALANGVSLTASQVVEILDDLWICNIITQTKDRTTFEIANPHLIEFVRRMDFGNEIARLKKVSAS